MQLHEKYTAVIFKQVDEATAEKIIACLAEQADGFEEGNEELKAFFSGAGISTAALDDVARQLHVAYEAEELEAENWNALWESNFEPVVVDDFVAVRASFHPHFENVAHEILINPKMSFGTGHHATTWLMMQQMRSIGFAGARVFDFGTGTGILAILAEKLGAAEVIATDIDEWSIVNAQENTALNGCSGIGLIQSGTALQGGGFNVILANINKNVLLETIPQLREQLVAGGVLLLSGLLEEDAPEIVECAVDCGLGFDGKYLRNNWLCIKFHV
ncbi:50S ribosomal protein L11 methyltransferase [Niabella beijingensis]|uniref:50S ribosomal protein L11 methyltransferase n=1 Tax=Niabella beijingensis TaxID=2872700 RepID=UPI001CBE677F|nr:50S ribosomal protein L11 methyltransferase [Niabella beijingensis]MBZ4187960.1 50S ribosomal protein L11 methyltransferase [Niabella beijingensis]